MKLPLSEVKDEIGKMIDLSQLSDDDDLIAFL